MIACHCNAICDRTVLNAIAQGATTVDAVGEACGAGQRCGGCHDVLDTLVAAARAVEDAFGALAGADVPEMREAAVG